MSSVMEFENNVERDAYINSREFTILSACPGSGKTTCVARKISDLKKECLEVYGRYSGVACLSFTNIAKNEISEKLFELHSESISYPHLISTIDSFVNRNITLPFYHLLGHDCKRPVILDGLGFIDELWMSKFKYKNKDGKVFCFTYPPSSIGFNSDGVLSSNGNVPDEKIIKKDIWDQYCSDLWGWKLKQGYINSTDSAYVALYLIRENRSIVSYLSNRYPYLIIDEAQDTSKIQHSIIDEIIKGGLKNVDLVGDPYQSLYEWRDAAPELFVDKYNSGKWNSLPLTENRRSPQHIIDAYSLLRKSDDAKIYSSSKPDKNIPIHIYKYNDEIIPFVISHYEKCCEDFNLNNNRIVVRGNKLKHQMIGVHSEQKPWKHTLPYVLIDAIHHYEGNSLKDAFVPIRKFLIELKLDGLKLDERSNAENKLKSDHGFNGEVFEFIKGIPALNENIKGWTVETQNYIEKTTAKKTDFGIKSRNSSSFDKSCLTEPVAKFFPKPYSKGNTQISTIHQVKGETLSSILIFFSKNKHAQNISFRDVCSPGSDLPEERKRLIYVAKSRPTSLLALAFHESVKNDDIEKKYGKDVIILGSRHFDPFSSWRFEVKRYGKHYMASAYDENGLRKLTLTADDRDSCLQRARAQVAKYLLP